MSELALSAPLVDRLAALLFLGVLVLSVLVLMRRAPKLGVLFWLLVIGFVPDWMGTSFGGYIPPSVWAAFLVLAALLPIQVSRVGAADLLAIGFFASCALPFTFGHLKFPALFAALAIWGGGFLLGRLAPLKVDLGWIGTAIAVLLAVVGAAAVAEFVLSSNPFASIFRADNAAYAAWAPLQERGGVLRAEWAFGHSIALGSVLAMGVPFAFAARLPALLRAGLLLAMVGGITVTFSRTAMLSGALAVALSIYALRTGIPARVKAALLFVGAIAAVALQPLVSQVFVDAGDEATKSSDYRRALLSLVGEIDISGTSPVFTTTAGGESMFGGYTTVDSAVLLLGLRYGWLAVGFAAVLWLAAVMLVLLRRADPAVVAVVSVTPSLLTVAFITQYAPFFWFVAGLAVYSVQGASREVADSLQGGASESVFSPPTGRPAVAAR